MKILFFFLGVQCNELSISERFHGSKDLSNIWSQQNFLESSDIILSSYPNIVGAYYGSYLTIYFVTKFDLEAIEVFNPCQH
jgi:hypothetical protein